MSHPIPKAFANRPIWGNEIPLSQPEDTSLTEHFLEETDGIMRITDVTVPTLDFVPATTLDNRPRPAVLVCPGGGYSILAWSHEGIDIAHWLSINGYSAFILKYRCPNRRDAALADAARAMRWIRAHAEEFRIQPDKIGVIGFSAGAHLIARLSTLPKDKEPYTPQDSIDQFSCRPNFQMPIYPAYIYCDGWKTDPDFEITESTPPCFIAQAEDDTCLVPSAIAYYIALSEKKVPTELHILPRGGHGYGLVQNGKSTQIWPSLAAAWLAREIGL